MLHGLVGVKGWFAAIRGSLFRWVDNLGTRNVSSGSMEHSCALFKWLEYASHKEKKKLNRMEHLYRSIYGWRGDIIFLIKSPSSSLHYSAFHHMYWPFVFFSFLLRRKMWEN